MLSARGALAAGATLLAAATIGGAFGAHALQARWPAERLDIYETAVRYQFYHGLGLLAVGLAGRAIEAALLRWAGALILSGIVCFSGSLYALCFGAPRALGVVTPLGGLALIAGWCLFAAAMLGARAGPQRGP